MKDEYDGSLIGIAKKVIPQHLLNTNHFRHAQIVNMLFKNLSQTEVDHLDLILMGLDLLIGWDFFLDLLYERGQTSWKNCSRFIYLIFG